MRWVAIVSDTPSDSPDTRPDEGDPRFVVVVEAMRPIGYWWTPVGRKNAEARAERVLAALDAAEHVDA